MLTFAGILSSYIHATPEANIKEHPALIGCMRHVCAAVPSTTRLGCNSMKKHTPMPPNQHQHVIWTCCDADRTPVRYDLALLWNTSVCASTCSKALYRSTAGSRSHPRACPSTCDPASVRPMVGLLGSASTSEYWMYHGLTLPRATSCRARA